MKKENLFKFNDTFISRFLKIVLATFLMGLFFKFLILTLHNELAYQNYLKSLYLISSVLLSVVFYLVLSFFIKAFKTEDIKLKY